jgi:hypothetical protein
LFEHSPEGEGLGFPFAHFLVVFIWFSGWLFDLGSLFLDHSFFQNLIMIIIQYSLLLGIKLLPLFLENFIANSLMFGDTLRVELSTTTY